MRRAIVVVRIRVGTAPTEPVALITDEPGGPWRAVAGISLGLLLLTLVAVVARRNRAP